MYRLRLVKSRLVETSRALSEIVSLASWDEFRLAPTRRKTRWRRFSELVYISLRWGEVSNRYYMQGLDRVESRVGRDYMPYSTFRAIRNARNRRPGMGTPYDYVCVFQDKLLFERYFAAGGLPVVASEFVVRPARLIEPGGDAISVDDLIASGKPQRLFCKPQCGIRGANTFMLDIGANGLFIDGAPAEPSMLEDRLGDERYLFQRPITQHEQIAKLHPTSVNTLRVVTYRRADDTEVLSVSLRMGADGDITDNAGANRVFAGIRDEEGRLIETGYRATGERFFETRTHPTTGVRFRDCAIPFYRECLDLARRAHAWIPEVYSVGWDIAVTPEGPRLLEGNDDWSGRVMLMVPGFRDRVLRAHDLLDTGSPARLAPGEASAAARHH